jgi:flagellar motor switch protein FliG
VTGVHRAAILLGILGEERAAEIMKRMEPRELQLVAAKLATMKGVSQDDIQEVLMGFFEMMERHALLGLGSLEYIRGVLVKALGVDKANTVLERIKVQETGPVGIDALRRKDPRVIAEMLRIEHPQIIALVLVHLAPDHAAGVLSGLPDEVRQDVMLRIATLDSVPDAAVEELDRLIEEEFSENANVKSSGIGGPRVAAAILNILESSVESRIMAKIKEFNEALGNQIEELMFVFEDLVEVDDRSMQTLLREVPSQTVALALKGADDAVKDKVFRNMSKRAAEMLKEDLEVMGPVRLSEVEAAQKEILGVARRMAEAGDLVLTGKGGDRFV